jgi:WD40 repeat protein
LYLAAASTKGDVYFFTRPGPANLFRNASKGTVSEQYVCETFVKKSAHKGEVFAMSVGSEYIASGGVDGRVMFWTLSTGVLKNTVIVIAAEIIITQELYIFDILFLPSGDLLVALNSGGLFQVSPKSPNPILLSHQATSSPLLHMQQKLNLWLLGTTSGHILLHNPNSLLDNDSQPLV